MTKGQLRKIIEEELVKEFGDIGGPGGNLGGLRKNKTGEEEDEPDWTMLKKYEEDKKKTNVSKKGQKRVSQKIAHMTDKGECEDNPKQCQAIAYSMEPPGELNKKGSKK